MKGLYQALLYSSAVALLAEAIPVPNDASCDAPESISYSNDALPDPFTFVDSDTRVQTAADWTCRRQQISQLIQRYELGSLPTTKATVTGSFSNNTLTVTATDNGQSISFAPKITYPTTGTAPYPAVIAYGGLSIPSQPGVAVITFNNDEIGAQNDQSSRGVGKFFTLYGSNATAGAMTAWSWGVSRIIDALETTPEANIDATLLAVTGCSRNGKGALVAGALDDRIKLTIPQESGSGGDTSWRLSLAEQNAGNVVQTATEIVQENVWFGPAFNNYVNNLSVLPFDHHMLIGLVAPRGLLTLENLDYEWLSPESAYGCNNAGRTVYEALGAKGNYGFSQIGGHLHCAFPASQGPYLTAFFNKFLLGQTMANTSVWQSNQTWPGTGRSQWINWTTPMLQ